MGYGFNNEDALRVYGDGDGYIIIETYSQNGELTGRVKISPDRFEFLANECRELCSEAWKGEEND